MGVETDLLLAEGRIEEILGYKNRVIGYNTIHKPRRVKGISGMRPASDMEIAMRAVRRMNKQVRASKDGITYCCTKPPRKNVRSAY